MLSLFVSNSFRGTVLRSLKFQSQTALRCLTTPRPNDIEIPLDKIELKYSRSSGPGGTN